MRASLALALVTMACETPASRVEIPRSVGGATAASTVSAPPPASAVPDAGALPPIDSVPANADPELVKIARSICKGVWMEGSDGKPIVGCHSDAKSDGSFTAFTGDALEFCVIGELYRGAFTRAGAKEILVSVSQCMESDVTWDSANPGHAVIIEEAKDGYRVLKTIGGVNVWGCKPLKRSTQRDAVVCSSSFHAPPSGKVSYVFTLGGDGAHTIARLFADDASCMMASPDYKAPGGISAEEIAGVSVNGSDISIDVMRARTAPSAALDKQVNAICTQDPSATFDKLLPSPKKIRLDFTNKGETVSPNAQTKKLLDTFRAEAPSNYNGMFGVAPDSS